MKAFMVILVVLMVVAGVNGCSGKGIHSMPGSKNVALIEGECVVLNWDSSEAEWDEARALWSALRRRATKQVK